MRRSQPLWIWKHGPVTINDFAFFRKTIYLEETPTSATLRASAHHTHKIYVNGVRVDGYVSPAPSNPCKEKLCNEYDVAAHLAPGENVLAAIVMYMGGGGQNTVDGLPGFWAGLDVALADGTCAGTATDGRWKCLCDTPWQNGAPFQQNRRITPMEAYDARLEPQGWLRAGFDDSAWPNAVLSPINNENWPIVKQAIPEGAQEEAFDAEYLHSSGGALVYDAGRLISGWPRLTVMAARGRGITLRYSEDLDENGRVKHNVANERSETYCDKYIAAGTQNETWQPDFSYKAFRFIEVEGLQDGDALLSLKAVWAHTDIKQTADFACSEPLLNTLFDMCARTQKNNALGQLVDCPHREQAQYIADSFLQAENLLYHFDGLSMLEKVLSDFKSAQDSDGSFPFVYPSNYHHPDFRIKIPEWDLRYPMLMWRLYLHTGDKQIIARYFNTAAMMLDGHIRRIDAHGLVPKTDRWHISDWPYPAIEHAGDHYAAHNFLVHRGCVLLADMCRLLGYDARAARYDGLARDLRRPILDVFFNPDRAAFRDSDGSERYSQGTTAFAFTCGLVPKGHTRAALDHLVRMGHETGTLLSLDLLRALFDNGRGEDAYRILTKTDGHSWAGMARCGHRTMWEGFDDKGSHCHAWNGYIARIMTEYLAGIRVPGPGTGSIVIEPFIPESLTFAEARMPVSSGTAYVRWGKTGQEIRLFADLPEGCQADIRLRGVSACAQRGRCELTALL